MKRILVLLAMLVSMNVNAQWVQMGPSGAAISCFAVSGTNIFAGASYGGGVFLTTNNGNTWSEVNNGLTNLSILSLAVSGTNLFAGTNDGGGVFLSTNNGVNWNSIGLTGLCVFSLVVSGTNLYAGTDYQGVYLSTNSGVSWTYIGLTNHSVLSLAVSGTNLFAGTIDNLVGGVFLSTNNGVSWSYVGLNECGVRALAISGTNIFAGTWCGVYLSSNNGVNWIWVNNGITNNDVRSLAVSGVNLFAGTGSGGVFLSTNNGTNWINKNEGFGYVPPIISFLISNNYIFAGSVNHSIYRRSLSEIIGVQNISTEIPSSYSLKQNYPNPFNSMCNVQFSMCNAGNVKLVVYDVQGREVQTLVNERLKPGTYEAKFDGSMQNSGVYFYKLITDGFTETKRMILIK